MSEQYADLAATAEEQLADPSKPEAVDFAIDCARAPYEVGTLYMRALHCRRLAAESGRALMRWILAVNEIRDMVQADAGQLR